MTFPSKTREYRSLKKRAQFRRSKRQKVKVHAVSLQFRDIMILKGIYPVYVKENLVLGSDLGGEVVAVDIEVHDRKAGDRICVNFGVDHLYGDPIEATRYSHLGAPIDGVFTEYKVLPAHSLVRIPEHLSYEEGSTLPYVSLYGMRRLTAYNSLMGPVPLKGGDTVLIIGTGGVSIFGLQFAVASGATVIIVSSSDEKLRFAEKLGARHLINYKTVPDWDKEILEITNGKGVDHVLEVGGTGTLARSLTSVRYGGDVAVIGNLTVEGGDTSLLPLMVVLKAILFRGITAGSRTQEAFSLQAIIIDADELG
ncbi:uncharacterized protein FIBRA_03313 [Fibroporia radiculosa]|uniref:Enoyl reductase (ER) domain-containing protein n=1 Tax=Fibroporia radiculosa TaxID=599839 RepID=J4H2C1_9APHY|nr:uncharacterized protein FIBRA_03313 [Fibroporia radiculosa]CCM01264.1 predicted protein [Fibroporia radiculosa]